jgi:hypothetical protein
METFDGPILHSSSYILTLHAAQEVLEAALNAVGPDMVTPHGHAAAEGIASLLSGPYSKYT